MEDNERKKLIEEMHSKLGAEREKERGNKIEGREHFLKLAKL